MGEDERPQGSHPIGFDPATSKFVFAPAPQPHRKLTPAELIEELRDLARVSAAEAFPFIPAEETVEADAAAFIDAAVRFLSELAAGGGPLAQRAKAILARLN